MQRQKNDAGHLILFTRLPLAGKAKTRLIPALGAEGAALLQQRMSEAAFATLGAGADRTGASLEVCFHGGDEKVMRQWLPGADRYTAQGDGDLGDKLTRAVAAAVARKRRPVIVIGADCPALTPDHLIAAFAALTDHDLVGPAADGGYYLIGLQRFQAGLFADIPWSTPHVLHETLARANALGLHHRLLETLPDVDRPEDLPHLGHHPDAQ